MKLKEDEDERTLRETVDRCYKQGATNKVNAKGR